MEKYNFNQLSETSFENSSEKLSELLEKVNQSGRLLTRTVMTEKLANDRHVGTGSRLVIDEKNSQDNSMLLNSERSSAMFDFIAGQTGYALKKEGISSAVTIAPIVDLETNYKQETVERKVGIFGKKVQEIKNIPNGTNKIPVLVGSLNSKIPDSEKTEPAYKIVYHLEETEENKFRDPTTNRTGCAFDTAMILPESIARKVFEEIQNNPTSIEIFLNKLDPVLMKELEPFLPKPETIVVVPENEILDAFIYNENGVVSSINSNFVKDYI